MAQKTEGHTFTRRGKYPWAKWTDGSQWRIHKGDDYTISTFNMQISLHGRANTQGLRVKSNSFKEVATNDYGYVTHREGLVFQFYRDDE